MNSIKVKFIGIMIIILAISLALSTAFVTVVEYLGISKNLQSKWNAYGNKSYSGYLVDDGYYRNAAIQQDPYRSYTIQHLHPYYMFSLPWRTRDRIDLIDKVVTINSDGFRDNPSNNIEYEKTAILLGGSTAFGHFSSSDDTTIASVLSRTLQLNVVNRNSPAWNSHQELVALAKYFDEYSLSISFTLSNDIGVACYENNRWDDGLRYLDSPESYIELQQKVNDIRGGIENPSSDDNSYVKGLLKNIFPDTYRLLWLIKESYMSPQESDMPSQEKADSWCSNVEPQEIALSFLRNQGAMNELSAARKARHIVVLQPHFSLIDKDAYDYSFRNSVYNIVIESDYCARNTCIDMRDTQTVLTSDALYNGSNIETAIFADHVHLLDNGVLMYTDIIAENLSQF
ncbi:hypothetical protein OBA40_09870 [Alphaproteobacteria bacterium]|nr:hypothetical protein [Alphaproteobacteria bacterium]